MASEADNTPYDSRASGEPGEYPDDVERKKATEERLFSEYLEREAAITHALLRNTTGNHQPNPPTLPTDPHTNLEGSTMNPNELEWNDQPPQM
jgi:hypothetical protein